MYFGFCIIRINLRFYLKMVDVEERIINLETDCFQFSKRRVCIKTILGWNSKAPPLIIVLLRQQHFRWESVKNLLREKSMMISRHRSPSRDYDYKTNDDDDDSDDIFEIFEFALLTFEIFSGLSMANDSLIWGHGFLSSSKNT